MRLLLIKMVNFILMGQLEELDNEGVYYLSDGKYTKLTDLDTGSEVEPYGANI